jgi:hypothetical protein
MSVIRTQEFRRRWGKEFDSVIKVPHVDSISDLTRKS